MTYLNLAKKLLVIVLCALTALASCRENKVSESQSSGVPRLQLETAIVEISKAPSYVELTGTVISQASVPISTKLMAEIKQLKVEVGQQVSKGQILVVLDDREIVAMRKEAGAFRAEAQAALSEVAAVHHQAEAGVVQAEAALGQSRAALADVQRDLERSKTLFDESVIAKAQLDKAQLAVDVARQNVERATAAVAQAQGSVAQAESKAPQVEAKKQQASAKDLQAAALQEYAILRAPFDGIITQRYYEQGQLSVPGQPIVVVDQAAGPRVSAYIPGSLAPHLAVGSTVQLEFDLVGEAYKTDGKVVVIGTAADPASRTIPIEVTLTNTAGLFSGQFVRLYIDDGKERERATVPTSSVIQHGEQSFVWRVSADGVTARIPVDIGSSAAGNTEILRGISAGETVVRNPSDQLYDGALLERGLR